MVVDLIKNIWLVYLDTAFWMLIGLLAAGFIKSYISEGTMKRWVGGRGIAAIFRAALFRAPLPLCSCGVLPAAIGLRRAGASEGATLSFLVATPETGVDSIGVSYVLLGPFMTVVRVFAAVASAIITGMLAVLVLGRHKQVLLEDEAINSCCSSGRCSSEPEQVEVASSCCSSDSCSGESKAGSEFWSRNLSGLKYALSDIWDDITYWLLFGIAMAAVLTTFFPEQALADWGSGLPAMILMLLSTER